MHRLSIRFLFILLLYPSFSFVGEWGQWYHKTPGKNLISNLKISDTYRNIFSCRTYNTVSIHYLEKWYFYKKHIVGKYGFDQPNKYFIINEKTCVVADYSSLYKLWPVNILSNCNDHRSQNIIRHLPYKHIKYHGMP